MEFIAGRWRVRLVPLAGAGAALELRARVFREGRCDEDAFDAGAHHLLIEDGRGLAACARLSVQDGTGILASYTGQRYDLRAFASRFPRTMEVGRVCTSPDVAHADTLRLLLGALARVALFERVSALFGCASFPADGAGLAGLTNYRTSLEWIPGPGEVCEPATARPGPLPPLLRTCLHLGAVVSNHAVVDPELNTQHVFTALPVASIPRARARRLRTMLDAA